MVRDIIKLILDFFVLSKSWIITDIDWGTLFILCLCATGGLRYIAGKYSKTYDHEATKKRWFGLGRGLAWTYAGRNKLLRWGLLTSSVCLAFTFITVGSTTNGTIADTGSALTSLETGQYVIIQNCGDENGKTVLYCRQLCYGPGGNIEKAPDGTAFKTGTMEVANGTSLNNGAYLEVSLSQGKTWISGLSESQARARLAGNQSAWSNMKRSLASTF